MADMKDVVGGGLEGVLQIKSTQEPRIRQTTQQAHC